MPINRILTDEDRELYAPLIKAMWNNCPDMMARKIDRANVQQAFVLNTVQQWKTFGCKILSVGCFEDTAYEYLMNTPNNAEAYIVGIDPQINTDLHNYVEMNPDKKYDIVFSTSVLEHVKDDEQFLRDMVRAMKIGGTGILTMDFKDDYKNGDPLPYSNVRFYTKKDLYIRLKGVIGSLGCALVDQPDWGGKDNFVYQGHHYSFATFVFRDITPHV